MQDRLREKWGSRTGRTNEPKAAVIDAHFNRSSPHGGESGLDVAKKVKGRKRNLVIDTMGLVIALTVTAASVQDRMPLPPCGSPVKSLKYFRTENFLTKAGRVFRMWRDQ